MSDGDNQKVVAFKAPDDRAKRALKQAMRREDALDRSGEPDRDPFGGAALFLAMIDAEDD